MTLGHSTINNIIVCKTGVPGTNLSRIGDHGTDQPIVIPRISRWVITPILTCLQTLVPSHVITELPQHDCDS